jgi:ABC-2 type transport system permease protein
MMRANFKLVFRNKQSLFLMILIPILSSCILSLTHIEEGQDQAHEFKMNVLIVDESKTVLSQKLVNSLRKDNSMIIQVAEAEGIGKESIKDFFTKTANKSIITSFIYIPKDFNKKIFKGDTEEAILLFHTGTDERIQLLDLHLNMILQKYLMFSSIIQGEEEAFNHLLEEEKKNETKSETRLLDQEGEVIPQNEEGYSFSLGMFVAALTMTLIFSNNFIVALFLKEKHNRVLKRIQMTHTSMLSYVCVKVILAVGSLIIQTGLIMLSIKMIFKINLGISIWLMGLLILGLGLVFTCASICSASFFDNITTANYVGFALIIITNMLSGLYFPFESVPTWMKNIAMLLPQRWFILAADDLLRGSYGVLYQYGMVIGALMLFFLSVSSLGFKYNRA